MSVPLHSRRQVLSMGGAAGSALLASTLPAAESIAAPGKIYRIGVISASAEGKPQKTNGHTWHFCPPFAQEMSQDAVKKYLDPGSVKLTKDYFRNPALNFGQMPFADTRLTHVYAADPTTAKMFAEGFPGVEVASSVEQMVKEVDAIWLGDAVGTGNDHYDLVAPGLEKGLPTFCDKPIGKTVAGTRAILELATKHNTPIMSSSLFRHQWGTAEALRLRNGGEFGALQYVIASQGGAYSPYRWEVFGQHPTWMVMTLCGPGVEAVSMIARGDTCHALLTWPDRLPAEVWCGRQNIAGVYCETTAHFEKKQYTWSPAIEGNYWLGHSYQVFKMADTFRQMIRTRIEPVPHREILEVTAIIHAAARSLAEKSRLVNLAEVMG